MSSENLVFDSVWDALTEDREEAESLRVRAMLMGEINDRSADPGPVPATGV